MSRDQHQNKEYRALFGEAEHQGWTIGRGGKHYKMKCPNECKCMVIVSSTPSVRNGITVVRAQLKRSTCWEAK